MSLPYPGRYESHRSWSARCDEYERDQSRSRRIQKSMCTNWGGYNYRPVIVGGEYRLPSGASMKCLKTFPSKSKKGTALRFAQQIGGPVVILEVSHGPRNNITSREDYIVTRPEFLIGLDDTCRIIQPKIKPLYDWKAEKRDEVYNCDTH